MTTYKISNMQVPRRGYMEEDKTFLPTLWSHETWCVLKWKEDESFEDLALRYPELRRCYGDLENVLNLTYPDDHNETFGLKVYELESDDFGNSYYIISICNLDLLEGVDFLTDCVCVPMHKFSLNKFYIEYVLPLRQFNSDPFVE